MRKMKNVWVVIQKLGENEHCLGVHSTRQLARKWLRKNTVSCKTTKSKIYVMKFSRIKVGKELTVR